MSAAMRSMRGSAVLRTASPSRKKLKVPTSDSASSVVSSRPRLPGVTRACPKRADMSATAAAGLSTKCQTGREIFASCRHRGFSSRASMKSRTLAPRLGVAAQVDQRDDPADHDDERAEREHAARDVGREPVDRAPEQEAEHAERDRPQAGGEHVVGQEAAQRHPRGAGDERRERPDEAEEAPDDDRHRAALVEEVLDLLEPLLGDLQPLAVLEQPPAALAPAELVGRDVADDAARPHDRDQRQQRDLALAGDQAADDHRGLARRDEAEERAGLQEGEQRRRRGRSTCRAPGRRPRAGARSSAA